MGAALNGHAEGPTIPASAETLLRFQVGKKADEPEREDAPVELLAAPTEKLHRAYRTGLVARGYRYPQDDEIIREIRVWLDDMREAHAANPEHGIAPEIFDRRLRDIERFQDLQFDLQLEAKQRAADAPDDEPEPAEPAVPKRPERLPRDRQLIVDRYMQLLRLAEDNCPGVQELQAKRQTFI